MISSFDSQNLLKLLKDFYTAVGIRISIFDDEFNNVCEYPEDAPSFCKNIRRSEEGIKACRLCDMQACMRAKKLRRPHIYTCHAGICEAITPIQIGGGVLGYAILAHMLPKENCAEAEENACNLAQKYGVNKEESKRAIALIQKKTEEEIHAAVSILDAIASYVYIQNLAKWKSGNVAGDIERFIKDNLSGQIDSSIICRRFNISRTVLYQLSKNAFGMSIMQYVNYCKMQLAKKLLKEGKRVKQVAAECGFNDVNYFCKCFKKHEGCTPVQYANR